MDTPPGVVSAAKAGQRTLRQSPNMTAWPGRSVQDFTDLVLSTNGLSEECLTAWEHSLALHAAAAAAAVVSTTMPPDMKDLFIYSTDHRLSLVQRLIQRVLALAGNPLAARTIVVSKDEQQNYIS